MVNSLKEFYYARQQPNESLDEWYHRLKTLFIKADLQNEETIQHIFLIGLSNEYKYLYKEYKKNSNITWESILQGKELQKICTEENLNQTKKKKDNSREIDKTKSDQTINNDGNNIQTQYNLITTKENYLPFTVTDKKLSLPYKLRKKLSSYYGREDELNKIHTNFQSCSTIVVHGEFAIGKTELANQYAWKYIDYYQNKIFWIKYINDKELNSIFYSIARELGIDYEKRELSLIVNDIYSFFPETQQCLFVFDNVTLRQKIESFLPDHRFQNIKLLITSPYGKWENINTIKLHNLSQEETKIMFKIITKEKFNIELSNNMVELIGGNPLVIQIFAQNINQEFDERKFKIEKILNKTLTKWSEHDYNKSIFTSFVTNLKKIQKLKSSLKVMIMNIIYIYPYLKSEPVEYSDIENFFLLDLFTDKTKIELYLKSAVETLAEFSFITYKDDKITIKNLIKHIIFFYQNKLKDCSLSYENILDFIINNRNNFLFDNKTVVNNAHKYIEVLENIYNYENPTLLKLIIDYNTEDLIKILSRFIKNPLKHKVNQFYLCKAVEYGYLDIIKLFINRNKKLIFELNKYYAHPLHIAAEEEQIHVLKYFIEELKMPINLRNESNFTPLHSATYFNNIKAVSYLIENKCNINARDRMENIALHFAAEKGYEEIVNILIDNNSWRDIINSEGNTPLHLAAAAGNLDVVKLLISIGCDSGKRNGFYKTAIELAVINGHLPTVVYLCEKDHHLTVSKSYLLELAHYNGHFLIKNYLSQQYWEKKEYVWRRPLFA